MSLNVEKNLIQDFFSVESFSDAGKCFKTQLIKHKNILIIGNFPFLSDS